MAHIFKFPTTKSKGTIVFTHKEWGYFSGIKGIRTLKRMGKWPEWVPGKELKKFYFQQLLLLKKYYFIGVHFGHFYPYEFNSEIADFVISGKGTLPLVGENIFRIPFNSRNFIPKYFSRNNSPKTWDIISIGMNVTVKNYALMFESIKKLLACQPDTRVLLIVPSQRKVKRGLYHSIASDYYKIFSREEQKHITFLYLHPDLEYGINQKQLIHFYNQSKIFTLFSEKEGESRVISEALCCGLPVVVYSKLLGGGQDLLTKNNSVLFDDYSKAHFAWIQAMKKFPDGILDTPEKFTREDSSVKLLIKLISNLYHSKGQSFDGTLLNTDHLDMRLPGHYFDVPWMLDSQKPTADILSIQQFRVFYKNLIY